MNNEMDADGDVEFLCRRPYWVEVTMAEAFGVRERGKFYEEVGAIRDVVQNHLLQVLALVGMDAPAAGDGASIDAAKVAFLRAVRPLAPADVVRGQYRGYRSETGVAPESNVETYAAVRLSVDNDRWAGTPIVIRAGKCLPVTATEVFVKLCQPPAVFTELAPPANYFRFRVTPDLMIALGALVKKPGDELDGEPVELVVSEASDPAEMGAYEELLYDAIRGNSARFARQDYVEEAWRIVDPVLKAGTPVNPCEAKTWGPGEVDQQVAPFGGWHNPVLTR